MPEKIAVILVRGVIGEPAAIHDTLRMLGLNRKNTCVVLEKTQSLEGMVQKVKNLVTWGEVSTETLGMLGKRMKENVAHLNPPRKGFGRKGIKVGFNAGGTLGYRGDKINELLQRMI